MAEPRYRQTPMLGLGLSTAGGAQLDVMLVAVVPLGAAGRNHSLRSLCPSKCALFQRLRRLHSLGIPGARLLQLAPRLCRLLKPERALDSGLAPLRPSIHQIAALLENIRPPVGPLDLRPYLMPHGLLDDCVWECRDLFRPCPEGRPEPVGGDPPAACGIDPLFIITCSCASEGQEGHVGQRFAAALPREYETRNPHVLHLSNNANGA